MGLAEWYKMSSPITADTYQFANSSLLPDWRSSSNTKAASTPPKFFHHHVLVNFFTPPDSVIALPESDYYFDFSQNIITSLWHQPIHNCSTMTLTTVPNISSSEMTDPGIMHPIEDLFLDISIHEVFTQTMVTFVEPWKTMYINSIREQRYGDAIWARYCIEGGVENGVILGEGPNPDITVLDQVREDALEAKENEPGLYADALELYRQTSSEDGHPEVLKIIFDTDRMEVQD